MDIDLEYRVRPVTRYIVTKFEGTKTAGSVGMCGEFDNADIAYNVAYALCKADHQRLGYPLDDMRVKYPATITEASFSE